jgi:DNA-binding NarL/FixJ family response regulator
MGKFISVIHADDHEIVRTCFRTVFESNASNVQVIGQASCYQELYSVLAENPSDILLLDGVIKGGSTSYNLPIIRRLYPRLKILLLWLFADENSLSSWIHLLDGHLPMGHINEKDIIKAIETVMKGEKYFVLPVSRSNTSDLINAIYSLPR